MSQESIQRFNPQHRVTARYNEKGFSEIHIEAKNTIDCRFCCPIFPLLSLPRINIRNHGLYIFHPEFLDISGKLRLDNFIENVQHSRWSIVDLKQSMVVVVELWVCVLCV